MKNTVILLLVAVFFMSCTAEEYEPWGVWNFGEREDADYYGVVSGKVYSRIYSHFLTFSPTDEKDSARIHFMGGYFKINEVMYNNRNKKIISFYAEINISTYRTGVGYLGEPEKGKINMHFIDNDHIWLEVDYTDKKYPTTPDFPAGDFSEEKIVFFPVGKKVIFWRGEYIGEYDDPKTQEYIKQIHNISP
jgi:hypothetical protein